MNQISTPKVISVASYRPNTSTERQTHTQTDTRTHTKPTDCVTRPLQRSVVGNNQVKLSWLRVSMSHLGWKMIAIGDRET